MENDFKTDVREKFSEADLDTFYLYIDKRLEDTNDTSETINEWDCSLSIEKHDALNHSYHFEFNKEDNSDISVCVSYYTGIDVGCEMVDFSVDGLSLLDKPLVIRVFSHVDIKWSQYLFLDEVKDKSELSQFKVMKIENLFRQYKEKIESLINKQSYDNYVTGGGTVSTNRYYREELQKIEDKGIFWDSVYVNETVERNII